MSLIDLSDDLSLTRALGTIFIRKKDEPTRQRKIYGDVFVCHGFSVRSYVVPLIRFHQWSAAKTFTQMNSGGRFKSTSVGEGDCPQLFSEHIRHQRLAKLSFGISFIFLSPFLGARTTNEVTYEPLTDEGLIHVLGDEFLSFLRQRDVSVRHGSSFYGDEFSIPRLRPDDDDATTPTVNSLDAIRHFAAPPRAF